MIPSVAALHNSPAFDALDATEKGWINYLLGMLFTKLAAAKMLDMPWLLHFKWFQALYPTTSLPGGSTPDFVGFNPLTQQFNVLEAKGRSSGYSNTVIDAAKAQAAQAVTLNGQPAHMHIGALLYREYGERLAMAMADPEPEGPPREIADTRETWAQYYRVPLGLVRSTKSERRDLQDQFGFTVDLDEKARPLIEQFFESEVSDWRSARDALLEWSANREKHSDTEVAETDSRTFGDGIKIGFSPDWRDAFVPDRRPE